MKRELIEYDINSNEASIKFSDGNDSIIVYCPYLDPPELKNEYDLIAFLPDNIMRTHDRESISKNNNGYYSYTITAKLIERTHNKCKVSVKGMVINIDDVPSDIETGENITFDIIRIDYSPL